MTKSSWPALHLLKKENSYMAFSIITSKSCLSHRKKKTALTLKEEEKYQWDG